MIKSGRGSGELQRTFVYSQTQIFCSDKLPQGNNSSTSLPVAHTRRGIFCGSRAGAIAYGRGYGEGKEVAVGFNITSDFTEVMQWQRIRLRGIFGIIKIQFADTTTTGADAVNDNAVIVVTNYTSQAS